MTQELVHLNYASPWTVNKAWFWWGVFSKKMSWLYIFFPKRHKVNAEMSILKNIININNSLREGYNTQTNREIDHDIKKNFF